MAELSNEKIQEIVRHNLKEALEEAEGQRLSQGFRDESELQSYQATLSSIESDVTEQASLSDFRGITHTAKALLEEWGIQVDENSLQFKKLCRELLKSTATFCKFESDRTIPDPAVQQFNEDVSPSLDPLYATTQDQQQQQGPTLSEALELYVNEQVNLKAWNNRTLKSNKPMLKLFVEIVGEDFPVSQLSFEQIRNYKAKLLQLPANSQKKKAYRDKTVQELLEMDIPESDRMSTDTLKNRFNKTSSFILWCKRQGYLADDSIKEVLTIKKKKQDHEHRDPFSTEDLKKLFHSPEYLEGTFDKNFKYWVPLLGLFTGARLEEICQLHLEDVIQEEGLWCIDINSRGIKTLKNASSQRVIPLHTVLTEDLRFLSYVEKLKNEGETLLFPELKPKGSSHNFSHNPSKWFGRYRDKVGIPKDPDKGKKVFHSFRHTIANWCDKNGVPEKVASRMLGHSHDTMTYGRYSTDTAPSVLYREIVSKLDFGLDFSKIVKKTG